MSNTYEIDLNDPLVQSMRRKPPLWWQKLLSDCAYCVTSGGVGVFAGHAGCVITPIVTALAPAGDTLLRLSPFTPVTTLGLGLAGDAALVGAWYLGRKHELKSWQKNTAAAFATAALSVTAVTGGAILINAANYQPIMMLAIGSSLTGAMLGGWYAIRGRFVSKPMRWVTIGFAVASLVTTTALKTPHMYDMWQTYLELTDGGKDRNRLIEAANDSRMGLDELLSKMCSTPTTPQAIARSKMSDWDKIKASFSPI